MSRGVFITVEGGEGVGKTTHIARLRDCLASRGVRFTFTREPGGTPLAETLRGLLLQEGAEPMSTAAELLLVFAARAQHIQQVIQPALGRGEWVVCDRFTDATYAYQGGGRQLPQEHIATLETLVQGGLRPDLTLLLDAPVEVCLARTRQRGAPDRIEGEGVDFFQRVRHTYLERAQAEPGRFRVIDTNRPLDAVGADLDAIMEQLLNDRH